MSKKQYNLSALEQQAKDLEIKITKLTAQLTIVKATVEKAKAQSTFERTFESKLGNLVSENQSSQTLVQD